jgi:hypothetical protein
MRPTNLTVVVLGIGESWMERERGAGAERNLKKVMEEHLEGVRWMWQTTRPVGLWRTGGGAGPGPSLHSQHRGRFVRRGGGADG